MENGLFDKGFDMDKFIERRLVEIEDLEERRAARTVMTEVFRELYHYTQAEYQKLEERIADGLYDDKEYIIKTGLIERKYYDATNDEMYPMIAEDTKKREIDMDEVFSCMEEGKPYRIYSVFLEADQEIIKKLARSTEKFACTVLTAEGEYQGTVSVQLQKRYQELLNGLYHIFQNNGIPWRTVCAPYLYRIFDVSLESFEMPEREQIERIKIDFREYESFVRYEMIPVWNIEKQQMIADVEPEPCEDQIHYRHAINEKRMDKNSQYLVADEDVDIYEIEHRDDLLITTTWKDAKKWLLYRITKKETRQYDAPLWKNQEAGKPIKGMRTQAGIFKYIHMLGFAEYLTLKRISFPERYTGEAVTYSMDHYVTEEIKIPANRTIMLLEFENQRPGDYLVKDVMSYLVTALQREYREYQCIGAFF